MNELKKMNNRERKELPYIIPKVCTYPYFTALNAILEANGIEEKWILNNYILIWLMHDMYDIDYWIDFKFGNEEIQEEFCPMIKKEILSREVLEIKKCSIEEAVKEFINRECYVMVSVDVFYIANWWMPDMKKRHFRHQLCIYGYDFEGTEELLVADFIGGKYKKIRVSLLDFKKGYYEYSSYVPYESFGEDIWLLSVNRDKSENFSVKKNIWMLEDFLMSQDAHIINHIQLEQKEHKYVFGLNIFGEIAKYLEFVKKERRKYIDRRPFHIIFEMQKVMKWRMKYIQKEYGKLVGKNAKLMKMIEQQCIEAEILQSLVLKYNISNQRELIDTIIKRTMVFRSEEKKMLERFLQVMKEIQE